MLCVLADHHDAQACRAQHASDQLRELAVADHGRLAVRANVYLFQNFARRGERLGEDGCLIGNARGHAMQIHDGQREVFGERAVVAEDSQHAPPRAVRRDSAAAIAAWLAEPQARARQIDFADDAPPDPAAILRARDADDFAHKFVAERAVKIVIAAQNFDVGVADSREANAHEGPAWPQSRQRFLNDGNVISVCDGGEHRENIGAQADVPGKAGLSGTRLQPVGFASRLRGNPACDQNPQAEACATKKQRARRTVPFIEFS